MNNIYNSAQESKLVSSCLTISFYDFTDICKDFIPHSCKFRLPNIIKNLSYAGEWDLKLYQIPDQLKIKHLYGYYRIPEKGKLILELSYMNVDENIEVFINDGMIHIYTYSSLNFDEKDEETGIIKTGSVMEEFITVLLYHKSKKRSYVDENMEIDNDLYFRYKNSSGLKMLSNFSFD